MVWANSILLAMGGLMVGIPIVIHLLMQPKPKPMIFPALRFVRENQRTNQRSMRLRHWILLALRALLILIVAAALAGPSTASNRFGTWVTTGLFLVAALVVAVLLLISVFSRQTGSRIVPVILGILLFVFLGIAGYSLTQSLQGNDGPVIGDQRAPVAAVLLVDVSPRMNYQYQNETSLERAKEMANWLLEQLPPESQISILLTDGDEPYYSVDLQSAKKRIDAIETGFLPTPINQRIEKALEFLRDSELSRRELYVLSDLTKKSWQLDEESPFSDVVGRHRETSVYVIDVGSEKYANFALDQVRLQQSTITQKDPLKVQVRVTLQGQADLEATSTRNLIMKLEKPDPSRPVRRDGKTILTDRFWPERKTSVTLREGQSTLARFELDGLSEGVHHGTIELEGEDGLSVDNRVHFTVEVKPAWPVLVVRPSNISEFFIVDVLDASRTSYEAKVIDQSAIGNEDLSEYRAVFLLDPTGPSDTTWEQLAVYVENGGAIAMFLGPNARRGESIAENFSTESAFKVLPAKITDIWRNVFLSPDNLTHPIMAAFRQNVSSFGWPNFPVHYYWGVRQIPNGDDGAATEIILRYSDGNAALIERRIGQGRVLMMTTPMSEPRLAGEFEDWNVLTQNNLPGFLLARMIGEYMVSLVRGQVNYEIGQFAILPNDSRVYPERYRIFTPRDEEPGAVISNEQRLRYRFTDTPGHYRLKAVENGVVLRGFSARLPERATDLARFDEKQLEEILGKDQFSLSKDRFEISREQGALRMGREFYPLLVLLLAAILVLEWLFSNYFYAERSAARSVS